ncbi:MAG: hydroxymethylglutaryl-CoA lyase [Flavobacteriales bacterium]
MSNKQLKIVECPRDAMQGIQEFIPTEKKINYIDQLLKVGYDTLDMGSFVSPKAVPQLKDTADVLKRIEPADKKSALLVIVANKRGAEEASAFDIIDMMGYPFSISETFQQKNTNSSIEESLTRMDKIVNICERSNKEPVIYVSMAFGNPYDDEWDEEIAIKWTEKLVKKFGIKKLALADTIAIANPERISRLFTALIPEFPDVKFSAHFHTTPENWEQNVKAAYDSGCVKFDAAMNGYGGCPMAKDDLVGNLSTENLLYYAEENSIEHGLDKREFDKAKRMVSNVFP